MLQEITFSKKKNYSKWPTHTVITVLIVELLFRIIPIQDVVEISLINNTFINQKLDVVIALLSRMVLSVVVLSHVAHVVMCADAD